MRSNLDAWIEAQEGLLPQTREIIESLQLKKLNRLLGQCRAGRSFYAALPKQLSSLEDLKTLPFTSEQDLVEHGGRMLTVSQSKVARITSDTTSGTTGKSKRLYYSPADRERTASFFSCGIGEFVTAGDTVAIAMPFSGVGGLGELIAKAVLSLHAQPVEWGIGKSYGEMLELMERFSPVAYIGFPLPLLSLLRLARALGRNISLRRALVSADVGVARVTSCTEQLLGSKLFPHYGSREIGLGGAITCSAHAGMHIRENDIIAEIVDKEGNPVPDGQAGELVVSTIGAEAMPLIRYRTGDRAVIAQDACPCGSVIRRLVEVERMAEEPGISSLDEQLFDAELLVDYRAFKGEGQITIEALVLGDIGTELQVRAQQLFPDDIISLSQKHVSLDDKPSYAAKRYWL